jgi:LacI family transcriptional regulator/LacI family purine nucleotide synthesis repressor
MANIYDIAEAAGVSIATVSKVVNDRPDVSDETKKEVLKVIEEKNYAPNSVARSLTTNESKLVGVFFNNNPGEGIQNMFFQEVIFGMERKLGKEGYDYVYFSDQKWHDQANYNYLEQCKDRLVDGAILLGLPEEEERDDLLNSELPVVVIDLPINNETSNYIMCDHRHGARQAVEYLYSLGHRKIGMIMGAEEVDPVHERAQGYQEVINKYDLSYRSEWIKKGPFEEKTGYEAMKEIIKLNPRPTALFCHSDVQAIGALQAIKEAGLNVPEDFSLIGFDDIEISKYITPALTTMNQHSYKLGEKAVNLLLDMIHNPGQKIEPVQLETELMERDSCREIDF